MNVSVENIKKFISEKYYLLVTFVLYLIVHMTYTCHTDDYSVISTHKSMTLQEEIDYLKRIANGWTSRLIVNPFIHGMAHLPIGVWILLDTIMIVMIVYFISELIDFDGKEGKLYAVAMMLLFPFEYMMSAGWMVTTMTYIWPIAIGLYFIMYIKKYIKNEKIKVYEYVLYTLALIYSANVEQISVVMLGIVSFTLGYALVYKKRNYSIYYFEIIAIISFGFHALSPGNASRELSEIATWFSDYGQISLIKKIELGFSSSLMEFVFKYNVVFLILTFLLLILVWDKYNDKLYRVISSIPFVVSFIWGPGRGLLEGKYKGISQIADAMTAYGYISVENYMSYKSYIPIVMLGVVSICLLASIYIIYGNSIESIVYMGLLILGLASRMVLAFSPTVWASSQRTYSVFYIILIIIVYGLIKKIMKISNRYIFKTASYVIIISAVMNYINLLLTIYQA